MTIWNETLLRATPFVNFLKKGDFFSKPYHGDADVLVTSDPRFAMKISTSDDLDGFLSWEDVIDEIHDNFQFSEIVDEELKKNNWFGYMNGNYHNADEKLLMDGEYRVFEDQMYGAVNSIFQFYANDEFPAIWEKVLQVYLHDGFPCGWEGDRENGRIVVFSNY